jgi:hypothetical protein
MISCIESFLRVCINPTWTRIGLLATYCLIVCKEMTERNMSWGLDNIAQTYDIGSRHMQSVLALGLENLLQITEAPSIEERHRTMQAQKPARRTHLFLHYGLTHFANELSYCPFTEDLSLEEARARMEPPYFTDPDPGPFDSWAWACNEESMFKLAYHSDRQRLREGGYVFWDRARLDEMGIFEQPWENCPRRVVYQNDHYEDSDDDDDGADGSCHTAFFD